MPTSSPLSIASEKRYAPVNQPAEPDGHDDFSSMFTVPVVPSPPRPVEKAADKPAEEAIDSSALNPIRPEQSLSSRHPGVKLSDPIKVEHGTGVGKRPVTKDSTESKMDAADSPGIQLPSDFQNVKEHSFTGPSMSIAPAAAEGSAQKTEAAIVGRAGEPAISPPSETIPQQPFAGPSQNFASADTAIKTEAQAAEVSIENIDPIQADAPVENGQPVKLKTIADILEADDSSRASSPPETTVQTLAQGMSGEGQLDLTGNGQDALPAQNSSESTLNIPAAQNFESLLSKGVTNIDSPQQTGGLQAKVFDQMAPRILELAALSQAGLKEKMLKIRLNPAELGTVEVTLIKNAAGRISAHFQTESEGTRQILNESLTALRASLENSGWHVEKLEISCRQFSSGDDSRGEGRSPNFGPTEHPSAETSFGVHSNKQDDSQTRLVSLRA